MTSKALATNIASLALEKKGKQIMLLDITGIASFTDLFVIISGDSDIHLKAIADHIEKELKKKKIKIYHKEGYQSLQWILLDYVDVIVHIFNKRTREHYGIERLWGDAKIKMIEDK